jgi:hypothetical protein
MRRKDFNRVDYCRFCDAVLKQETSILIGICCKCRQIIHDTIEQKAWKETAKKKLRRPIGTVVMTDDLIKEARELRNSGESLRSIAQILSAKHPEKGDISHATVATYLDKKAKAKVLP